MDHESLKNKVFELYDGELPSLEKAEVEQHLAACAECRGLLEGWRASASVLFARPRVAPSEAFVQRVMARIAERGAPGVSLADLLERARGAFTVPRLALAGAAALAALVFLATPDQKRPASPAGGDPTVYVAEVLENPYPENGDSALGTSVEEYFL